MNRHFFKKDMQMSNKDGDAKETFKENEGMYKTLLRKINNGTLLITNYPLSSFPQLLNNKTKQGICDFAKTTLYVRFHQ